MAQQPKPMSDQGTAHQFIQLSTQIINDVVAYSGATEPDPAATATINQLLVMTQSLMAALQSARR